MKGEKSERKPRKTQSCWRGAKEERIKERGREKVNKNEYQIKNEKTNEGRTTLKEESKATIITTKNERKR